MARQQQNDWWRFTATGAMGFIAALFLGWFAGLNDAVTRADVSEMIQKESPYVVDKGTINEGILEIKVIRKKIERIDKVQAAMAAKMGIEIKGEDDGG